VFRKEEHMSNNNNDVTAEQQQNLNKVITCAREALLKAEHADVPARYTVALIASQVKDEAEFGKDGLGTVEKELGLRNSTLYAYARVADVWKADEFAVVSSKVNAKGMTLSWSHWELLASVDDGRARRPLLERTLRECLTVRQLRAAIKEGDSPDHSAEAGTDSVQGIESKAQSKLTRLLSSMEKEVHAIEEHVLPRIAAGNTKLTDSELSEYRATLKSIEAAESILDRLKIQLKKITGEAAAAPAAPPTSATKSNRGKRRGKMDAPDQVPLGA